MGYLTPEAVPDGITCRALFVPNSEACLAIVRGAIQELTFGYNWTKDGALTPDEAAALFLPMFDAFCFGEGPCRVIGEIVAYAGATSPNVNWLVCNGADVLQVDYPDLYAVIGSLYGAAPDGYFRLPDLRGRTPAGSGTGAGLSPVDLGEQYGEQNHTLTIEELPAHNHTDSGHTHTTGNSLTGAAVMPGEGPVLIPNPIPASTGIGSANISNTGAGDGHNTIGPRLGITYLIVAKDG